jgi:HD-like signal output (HDOD) protein
LTQGQIPAFTLESRKRPAAKKETSAPRTPRFIDDIADGHVKFPADPRVVQRLISALRDPHADFRRIGDALSADPILSAKVLRMANSSIFGGQWSVASIDATVAGIGIVALNRLILSCGLASSFKEVPGIDHPTVGALWVESMGFPPPIADTIGNTVRPLTDTPKPLDVAVHSACGLATAVAQKDAADKALSALPAVLRAQFPTANGKANAAFGMSYDGLLKIESMF